MVLHEEPYMLHEGSCSRPGGSGGGSFRGKFRAFCRLRHLDGPWPWDVETVRKHS
jgi:hypothetical protein